MPAERRPAPLTRGNIQPWGRSAIEAIADLWYDGSARRRPAPFLKGHTMKRFLWASVGVVTVLTFVGCGASSGGGGGGGGVPAPETETATNANYPDVTDAIRQVCPGNDAELQASVEMYQAFANDGMAEADMLTAVANTCFDQCGYAEPCGDDCVLCLTTIVGSVYPPPAVDPAPPADNPYPDVTDAMREVCAGYPDSEIQGSYDILSGAAAAGMTAESLIPQFTQDCIDRCGAGEGACFDACAACWAALLSAVYD